jgi:hypothetical protein
MRIIRANFFFFVGEISFYFLYIYCVLITQIRLQTIPQRRSTLCYIPFPGLCSYPNDSDWLNRWFPHKISPFTRFVLTYPDEVFKASHPSSEIVDSPLFQAIVKFKWRAFAHRRYYLMILLAYLIYFVTFTLAVVIQNTFLYVLVLIMGIVLLLGLFRQMIILYLIGVGNRNYSSTVLLSFGTVFLPAVSVFLSLILEDNKFQTILRDSAICILWIGGVQSLVSFRRIGTFIIGKDFSKNFLKFDNLLYI